MTREEIIEQYPIALAEKEGKKIQYYCNGKWIDCSGSAIYGQEKLRIKPEEKPEQKRIIELSDDGETWFEATRFIPKCEKLHARVRVETQPTKRLPTIEDVEQWFLENKVFFLKEYKCYMRILSFTKYPCDYSKEYICLSNQSWVTIEEFCKKFTHCDGSSLYVTD